MVSIWPWKKDDSSPASFERTLSILSKKITTTQARLEQNRASSRRLRVLFTLYLSFAYLVYAIVALLVVGWQNMGPYEWSGMAGGPVLIYVIRTISSAVYDMRIDGLNSKLKDLQGQRAKTIQKLKEATKYDSTLELLEKYGGGEGKPRPKKNNGDADNEEGKKGQGHQQQQRPNPGPQHRVPMPIPATANIQRGNTAPPSNLSAPRYPNAGPYNTSQGRIHSSTEGMDASAEFAPNAYDTSRPPPPPLGASGQYDLTAQNHWYDRIMDLLLGEDETAAKNRFVLVCKQCRLVNGQAPPGTNSLSDLGVWKCMACAATNGEENEGKRIVKEVLGQTSDSAAALDDGEESDLVEVQSDEGSKEEEEAVNNELSGAKKRKGKGKK